MDTISRGCYISDILHEVSMKLRKALDEKLLDIRLRDRLLAEGKITKEQIEKALAQLPDDANQAVSLDESAQNVQ
jgi:hypothetical protein